MRKLPKAFDFCQIKRMQRSIIGKKVEKDHLGAGTRAIFLSDAKKISLKHKWEWK